MPTPDFEVQPSLTRASQLTVSAKAQETFAVSGRLLFFLSALLFGACASSTDASSHERVRAFAGKTVALRRSMLLVSHSGYLFGGANEVMSRRRVNYGLTEPGTYRAPLVFAKLPPGHRISIDSIQEEVRVDAYQPVMYGRTSVPQTGKEILFACVRTPLAYLARESLPWEEERAD